MLVLRQVKGMVLLQLNKAVPHKAVQKVDLHRAVQKVVLQETHQTVFSMVQVMLVLHRET